MKYSVYQINLSEAQINLINEKGFDAVPEQKVKMDMQFDFGGKGIENIASQAFADGHYGKVCMIEANNLDQVFHVGNVGPESLIDRGPLNTQMASISVGDIIEDEAGNRVVVSNFGFKEVA